MLENKQCDSFFSIHQQEMEILQPITQYNRNGQNNQKKTKEKKTENHRKEHLNEKGDVSHAC